MDGALFLRDSYLKTCKSKVLEAIHPSTIALDQTIFYPRGGGQPCDTGTITCKGISYSVLSVAKSERKIVHEVSPAGLQVGDEVECSIDWGRRYTLMRMHTAGHILGAMMYLKGALITGNQLDVDKTRFDFSMENFDPAAFQSIVDEANAAIARNLEVSVSFLPREEALAIPGAVKLAGALPPEIKELRMVKIGDVDYQADGGTHVKNTSEIGKIKLLSLQNKGAKNRRIYYALEPNLSVKQ